MSVRGTAERWSCGSAVCLQESEKEKWLVLTEKSQGDSERSGFILGHCLSVNRYCLLDARKADFLLGHHVKGNKDRSNLFSVVVGDAIGDSGLRLHFSQGSSGWGLGRGPSFRGGSFCTGARKAERSLSLEFFSI